MSWFLYALVQISVFAPLLPGCAALLLALLLLRARPPAERTVVRVAQGSLWAIGWGLICAVLGIAWLRKRFHPLAPAAFSVGDITVLSLVLDIVLTNAERTTSLVPTNQYIGVMMGYMLLLAANAIAADTELNLANIDLVGLTQHGLVYI